MNNHAQESQMSPAQQCPTALIHLILPYLTLRDGIRAALTCQHWLRAASTALTLHHTLNLPPRPWHGDGDSKEGKEGGVVSSSVPDSFTSILDSLCKSRFRRWVTALDVSDAHNNSIHHLACAHQLPRLKRLAIWLDGNALVKRIIQAESSEPSRPLILLLPPTLTSLYIHVSYVPITLPTYRHRCHQLLLEALHPAAMPNLQSLTLVPGGGSFAMMGCSNSVNRVEWDWSGLGELNQLRRLNIQYTAATPSILQQVKRLPLHSFSIDPPSTDDGWSVEALTQLCTPPHQLSELREFPTLHSTSITAEHMKQLIQMPQLTALHSRAITVDALPCLSHFKQLERLTLVVPRPHSSMPTHHGNDRDGMNHADDSNSSINSGSNIDSQAAPSWVNSAAHHLASFGSELRMLEWNVDIPFTITYLASIFQSYTHLTFLELHTQPSASDIIIEDQDHGQQPHSYSSNHYRIEDLSLLGSQSKTLREFHLHTDYPNQLLRSIPPMPALDGLFIYPCHDASSPSSSSPSSSSSSSSSVACMLDESSMEWLVESSRFPRLSLLMYDHHEIMDLSSTRTRKQQQQQEANVIT